MDALYNPTTKNMEKLDETFKLFYFEIRFTAFISSSVYFNSINFDSPIQSEDEVTFKEMIEDPESEITLDKISISDDIADYIINPVLYEAV